MCNNIFKKGGKDKWAFFNLVYSVGNSVAGVQFDSMEFGITDGGGRGNDGSSGVDKSSIRSSGIRSNSSGGMDKAGSSGITVVVVETSMSEWNSSSISRGGNYGGDGGNNKGSGGGGSFSGSLFTVGFGIESFLESCFGGFDFGGVFKGCGFENGGYQRFGVEGRCNGKFIFMDGCFGKFVFMNGSYGKFDFGNSGSNWEVGSLDTESQMIGDIVGGLDLAVGIDIGIRSRNSSISVSYFLFDRVEVRVTILNIAEFVLCLELR